ncbi:MAG: hypothetical protein HY682_12660 [Chloroflexi bacterium]|nr:hypothetical protein [Chloroflexota bacterium]
MAAPTEATLWKGRSESKRRSRKMSGATVRILSEDLIWARLFATNLLARGFRAEHGTLRWLARSGGDPGDGAWLIIDFGSYVPEREPFYRALIDRIREFRSRVIAVANGRWPSELKDSLPWAVLRKNPDMRVMVPSLLDRLERAEA